MKKIYLAIPYTGMEESSYNQANLGSVLILNQGMNVFSPITHSHPLTKLDKYEVPHTWDYWQHIDYQFIDWCDELWVLVPTERDGKERVENSTGVTAEIKYAVEQNKPVKFFEIEDDKIKFLENGGSR